MSTPNSYINICSGVRLNNRYDHTRYFDNATEQRNFFQVRVVKTYSNYTYLRKEREIKVDAQLENARSWTYLFFQNSTGKIEYYFITNVTYENEHMVKLSIELDVMQTYMFDWSLNRCMVEREHAETDEIGENTVDEGLEVGDYVANSSQDDTILEPLCIMTLATCDPSDPNSYNSRDTAVVCDGVFSTVDIFATEITNATALGVAINRLSEDGYIDAIVNMWMFPKSMVSLVDGDTWGDGKVCKRVKGVAEFGSTLIHETSQYLDGYHPMNKKLYQYPYNFLYVTNNEGSSAIYRYEKSTDVGPYERPAIKFGYAGTVHADSAVKIYPLNYKGVINNFDEGITLGSYPTVCWEADQYKLWLAQTQNQRQLANSTAIVKGVAGAGMVVGGAIATATGIGAGLGVGSVGGGVSMLASAFHDVYAQEAQKADKEVQPPQARGGHSGTLNVASGHGTFTYVQKCADACHLAIIDNFFDMYGYKTLRVKVPNIKSRPFWNYVKTLGSNVSGNIPHQDLSRINSIFDRGITFWKNTANIGDYDRDNRPVID